MEAAAILIQLAGQRFRTLLNKSKIVHGPLCTTTTSPTASPTTSGTPDPSSDPDPEVQQRDIQADMEKLPSSRRSPKVVKLRQGGMLRHVSKAKRAPAAKRDFGVKQIFGF